MRLAEIRLVEKETYAPEVQDQIIMANVWGDRPQFNDNCAPAYSWRGYLVDLDKMPTVPMHIEKVLACSGPLGLDTDIFNRVVPINQRVHVQVPGLGLLLLDEVEVLTDCCTDILNSHLRGGWRIVAVCPQPDQRRPDYVLGRERPEFK